MFTYLLSGWAHARLRCLAWRNIQNGAVHDFPAISIFDSKRLTSLRAWPSSMKTKARLMKTSETIKLDEEKQKACSIETWETFRFGENKYRQKVGPAELVFKLQTRSITKQEARSIRRQNRPKSEAHNINRFSLQNQQF